MTWRKTIVTMKNRKDFIPIIEIAEEKYVKSTCELIKVTENGYQLSLVPSSTYTGKCGL